MRVRRGRLKLVVTATRNWRLAYLDCWTTRDELIDACMASAHVPYFLDLRLSATYRFARAQPRVAWVRVGFQSSTCCGRATRMCPFPQQAMQRPLAELCGDVCGRCSAPSLLALARSC